LHSSTDLSFIAAKPRLYHNPGWGRYRDWSGFAYIEDLHF
jgi:hypothetical protein